AGVIEVGVDFSLVVRSVGATQEAELDILVEVLAFTFGNGDHLVALTLDGVHAAEEGGGEEGIVFANGAAERYRVARGDPDRRHRVLHAANGDRGRRDVKELAVVLERLFFQAHRDHVEELVVDLAGVGQIGAEALEFEVLVARADAKLETTVGNDVSEAYFCEEAQRLVERQDADGGTEADAAGLAGSMRNHHQWGRGE